MKIKKLMSGYFREEAALVEIPELPADFITDTDLKKTPERRSSILLKLSFAALIALSALPFIREAESPPELAYRAAEFSRKYDLESRICETVMEIKKISSKPSITGGLK